MMDWVLVGAVVLLGLFLSGFFSGAETGLYCVNRLRLHLGARLHDPRAVRLAGTLDDEPDIRPGGNVFWGSRASWYEETCAMAKFEALPPRKR